MMKATQPEPDFYEQLGKEPVSVRRSQYSNIEIAPPPEDTASSLRSFKTGVSRWACQEGTYFGVSATMDRVPPGLYSCGFSPSIGPFLLSKINSTDALIELPDSHAEAVLEEAHKFMELKPAFEKHGFLYKRGILMWGPAGSGKTCTLQLLIKMVIERLCGVAIIIDNAIHASMCLQLIRKIEPERMIIAILEDLDALVQTFGENDYLSLLDGESQVNNIIFVATTNYPKRLDRRFCDRPSRFDLIRYIGMPGDQARACYISTKLPNIAPAKLDDMIRLSKGFSLAHVREFIILTECFGKSIDESAQRLRLMIAKLPDEDSHPDKPGFGFVGEKT